MVVIDERDLHKTKPEILMDLIYEATDQRFPLDKINFGDPRELKTRPGDSLAPNTHIPVKVDVAFDRRYAIPEAGFLYRRREIHEHLKDIDWSQVIIRKLPFTTADVLPQINDQLSYPIQSCEVDDLTYDSIDQLLAYGLIIQAAPDSLLWCSEGAGHGAGLGHFDPNPIVTVIRVDGFKKWEGTPQP